MSNFDVTISAPRSEALARGKSFWQQWLPDSVVSNGTLAIADQGIVSLASFATNALVARACTQSDFGVYIMAISLLYFVRGVQEQLVSAPYTIYRHRRQGVVLSRYTGHTLIHQCALMVATLAAIGIFAFGISQYVSPDHAVVRALLGVLLVTPFFLLREYIRKLTFANFEFRSALILDCIVATLQVTTLLGLYWTSHLSIATAFVAIAIASGVGGIGWLLLQFNRFSFRQSKLWGDWLENWRFGRWALATHLIGCSTPYVMPWLVASLRGEAMTGALGACQTVVGMANMFVTGVSNFLSPRTAEAYAHGGTRALLAVQVRAAALFAVSLGGFTILMWAVGDLLAHKIMGETYAGLGSVMIVLAIALLANSLGMVAGNGIWAMNLPAHNLSADVTSLVVTFGVAIVLVPSQGALGAAWSAAIGHTCSALQRWLSFGRLVRLARLRERTFELNAPSQEV